MTEKITGKDEMREFLFEFADDKHGDWLIIVANGKEYKAFHVDTPSYPREDEYQPSLSLSFELGEEHYGPDGEFDGPGMHVSATKKGQYESSWTDFVVDAQVVEDGENTFPDIGQLEAIIPVNNE